MGVRRVEELVAWQLVHELKVSVYDLIKRYPAARKDLRYCDQLRAAVASGEANIVEGFHRWSPADFARFLGMARSSIAESRMWLRDGVDRGYFVEGDVAEALRLADRAVSCTIALKLSVERRTRRR